jgi:predicted transport protein
MRNKSLLKIILIIILILIYTPKVSAADQPLNVTLKTKKHGDYTDLKKEDYNDLKIAYDIEEMQFDITTREISISGWAQLSHQNNWGKVYTTISVALAYKDEKPTTFYEVDNYTERNNFGWHCKNGAICNEWKSAGYNATDDTLKRIESQADSCTGEIYGCIYRYVGFSTKISFADYVSEDKEIEIYIMVSYVNTRDESNKMLISDSSGSYSDGNTDNYDIYSGSKTKYGFYQKIGVDKSSCKVKTANGNSSCTDGKTNTSSGYIFTINDTIASLTPATGDSNIYRQTKVSDKEFTSVRNSLPTPSIYYYDSTKTEIGLRRVSGTTTKWPKNSIQKMYYISKSSNSKFVGYYIPASWVVPDKTIRFKVWEGKTCKPTDKNQELTCSHTETSYTIFDDDTNCDQTIIATTSDGETGSVDVRFTQKGILKVSLLNTYIKSGQGFYLKATYEDTITWELIGDYSYSDETKKTEIKNAIIKKIREYFTQSELLTNSKATFTFNPTGTNAITLGGTWELDKEYTGTDFVANSSATKGSVTVTRTFELYDAWSNINSVNSKGVEHIYSNTTPAGCTSGGSLNCNNNGKIFYTDLDLASGKYDDSIEGIIQGLSGIKYKEFNDTNGDGYIWTATYKCGIECYQGYYDDDPDPGTTTSTKKRGYKFAYREIDIDDPFPIVSGQIVGIDTNWYLWAEAIGEQNGKTTKQDKIDSGLEAIKKRIANTYDEANKEYVISINTDNITNIKNYNKNNNYIDDSGYNQSRYSKFLGASNTSSSQYFERFTRYINTPNQIGTCGQKRSETLSTTTCFCTLINIKGECVYDNELSGGGS